MDSVPAPTCASCTSAPVPWKDRRRAGVRDFLERIHRVLNRIDASPLTTIAAVHGVTFGGGFELALVCDLIIADKLARFCFPELRLGLIPGFGGIPRLKRDLGNAVVRDLLAHWAQLQCHKGTADRIGQSGCRRRRSLASGSRHGSAIGEVRSSDSHRRQTIHQAHSPRRTAAGDRYFLRPVSAARCAGRPEKVRGEHRRPTLFALIETELK